jgi:hypothetical protein
MDYGKVKTRLLQVFLAFLGLTALVGIVSVLTDFGRIQFKILGTCLTVAVASVCSMSCAAFIEQTKRVGPGFAGIALAVSSAALFVAGLWAWETMVGVLEYWKTAWSLGVAASAFAYAFLLVRPVLAARHRWVQRAAGVCVGLLALQVVVVMWAEIQNKRYYQALTIVAILVGLETVAIPILARLRRAGGQEGVRLVLDRLEGDVYTDPSGRKYLLKALDDGEEGRGSGSLTDT